MTWLALSNDSTCHHELVSHNRGHQTLQLHRYPVITTQYLPNIYTYLHNIYKYLHNIYKISTQYQRSLRPPPPGVNIRAPRDQQHRKCRTGSGGRAGSGSGYTLPDWAQGDWGEVQVAGGRLVYRDTQHFVQHTGQHTAHELFWGGVLSSVEL